jgi:hypothetical protein
MVVSLTTGMVKGALGFGLDRAKGSKASRSESISQGETDLAGLGLNSSFPAVVDATSEWFNGQVNGYHEVGDMSFKVEKVNPRKEMLEKKWDLDFKEGERIIRIILFTVKSYVTKCYQSEKKIPKN